MPSPPSSHDYAGLWWQFTRRNIESRQKGSHLEFVWPVLNPLIMLALYVLVFGYIFNGQFPARPQETRIEYALTLFTGLNILQFVNEVVGEAPRLILNTPNLVKRVVFPLELLPGAQVGGALFRHLVSMGLVFLGVLLFSDGLSWQMLWWPVVMAPLVLLTLGIAWLLSALGVFLRDLAQLTNFCATVLLYASAVFYPVSKVQHSLFWIVLKFNPFLHAVEQTRHVLLWREPPALQPMLYLYASGLILCFGGRWVFRQLQPHFADVL